MATTQHRPHGAFAGPVYGTLDGKTEDTGPPAVAATTQHRPHGAFAGQRYGTLSGKGASGAPTAPSSVTGTPTSGTTATIAWTDNSGDETGFDVEIAPVSTGTYVAASGATNPTAANVVSFAATGLTDNTEYTARVRAKGSGGDSAYATSSSFWTDNTGGGGGSLLEITPAAGALRFTGYVPTVARTANQWVAPGAGSLVFTGYVPTVDRTGSQEVAPIAGALRFTGYAPTVFASAAGNQTIAPAAGALRFTGYAPTVTATTLAYTSAGVLYLPIRMVSALWSAGGVGGASGEVAWLPPARQPLAYTDARTGQLFCDPAWYRFFEYVAETRLAGKTGPTLTAVVQTLTDTQTTAAAATVTVAEVQQQTQANAEALYVVRSVAKLNLLDGAEQIPPVEL